MLTDSLYYVTKAIAGKDRPRELLLETAELFDRDTNCVLLKAPTGYGKTTLSLAIYHAIKNGWNAGISLIHVLPLRSIGDDLYRKAVKAFYGVEPEGPSYQDIGVQHSYSPGAIALHRRFNITTLDTFILSFFKLPPFVLRNIIRDSSLGQYEVTRGFVYSSFIIFDEVHLYFQNDRMSSVFLSVLKALKEGNVPVLMTSATLPETIETQILDKYEGCKVIDRKPSDVPQRKVKVRTIREDEVDGVVREALSSGKSVMIVRNTVRDAVKDYERLKGFADEVVLLHGRLAEGERVRAVSKILGGQLRPRTLVVATQVIEAGVDISADLMVSSAAPPENLEQRMGRVARYGGYGEFLVVEPNGNYRPYYESEVEEGFMQAKEIEEGKRERFVYPQRKIVGSTKLSAILSMIQSNPMATSMAAKSVLKDVCNFVREDELVSAYPIELLDRYCEKVGENGYRCKSLESLVVPLEGKGLRSGKLDYLVRIGDEYKIVSGDPPKGCFFDFFLEVNGDEVQPVGIVVKGYKEGLGLV